MSANGSRTGSRGNGNGGGRGEFWQGVMRAAQFAAVWHAGQTRDGNDGKIPYITHPLDVVGILAGTGYHQPKHTNLLCAAALHDVVEDTAATVMDVHQHFGMAVTRLVELVTDDQAQSREVRHRRQLAVLQHTESPLELYQVRALRMADKVSNLKSLQKCWPCDAWPPERAAAYISFCRQLLVVCKIENTVDIPRHVADCHGGYARLHKLLDKTISATEDVCFPKQEEDE